MLIQDLSAGECQSAGRDEIEKGILSNLPHHLCHGHQRTVGIGFRLLDLKRLTLRCGAPLTAEGTALQKHHGPQSLSIVDGGPFDPQYHPLAVFIECFHTYLSFRTALSGALPPARQR